ncbi:HAD hydrolase-like protein [Methyloversatilis sp. MC4-4]|uniref:HAD hydrolase-like protein n=1 Tax=Methyloversatilis sp. MC4-4 TaxID=3132824 RepID=UPI003CEE974F
MTHPLVLFDFDGTLADSFHLFLDAWAHAAQRYGFRAVDTTDLDRLRRLGAREIVAEAGLPLWKLPAVAAAMRAYMRERADEVKLFDGVPEVLHTLKAGGAQIGIVTSNARDTVERVLGDDCRPLIDLWGCGASLFGKAAKTRRAMNAAGATPAQTVSVGDELRDLEVAQSLGLAFVAVAWGYTAPDRFAGLPGVRVCATSGELPALVFRSCP